MREHKLAGRVAGVARSPPADRLSGPMPRFDGFASMDNGSAALRASGSDLVT